LLSLGLYPHHQVVFATVGCSCFETAKNSTYSSRLNAREVMEGADTLKKPEKTTSGSRLDVRGVVIVADALKQWKRPPPASTLQCPTDSVRNPVIPPEWHRNGTGICRNDRNPQEWHRNRTGMGPEWTRFVWNPLNLLEIRHKGPFYLYIYNIYNSYMTLFT